MRSIFDVDWQAMFVPTVSLLELFLRGTVMYGLILAALRLFRRDAGALNTADLLVVVLVADAAQNAMGSEYRSLTEGAVLLGTIFGWNYLLDWLSFRSPRVYRLLNRPPLLLVRDGKIQRRNLRQELMTIQELEGQLREQGIENVGEVKACRLEGDGQISVIRYESSGTEARLRRKPVA
jgi:uncharacterized membrane protein YcaP (DUF421 family)